MEKLCSNAPKITVGATVIQACVHNHAESTRTGELAISDEIGEEARCAHDSIKILDDAMDDKFLEKPSIHQVEFVEQDHYSDKLLVTGCGATLTFMAMNTQASSS